MIFVPPQRRKTGGYTLCNRCSFLLVLISLQSKSKIITCLSNQLLLTNGVSLVFQQNFSGQTSNRIRWLTCCVFVIQKKGLDFFEDLRSYLASRVASILFATYCEFQTPAHSIQRRGVASFTQTIFRLQATRKTCWKTFIGFIQVKRHLHGRMPQ